MRKKNQNKVAVYKILHGRLILILFVTVIRIFRESRSYFYSTRKRRTYKRRVWLQKNPCTVDKKIFTTTTQQLLHNEQCHLTAYKNQVNKLSKKNKVGVLQRIIKKFVVYTIFSKRL